MCAAVVTGELVPNNKQYIPRSLSHTQQLGACTIGPNTFYPSYIYLKEASVCIQSLGFLNSFFLYFRYIKK
jgi:hypothetical protein